MDGETVLKRQGIQQFKGPAFRSLVADPSHAFGGNLYGSDVAPGHPIFDMLGPPTSAHFMPERTKYSDDEGGLHPCYMGGNNFLRDTVNQAVFQACDFFTSTVLPFSTTTQLNISWDISRLDRSIVGSVPQQGISKVIRSSRYKKHEKLERRGLAMVIEKDFYATPEGIAHFRSELIGLVQSVQNTLNIGCMATLVHSADRSRDAHQTIVTRALTGAVQTGELQLKLLEIATYALLQTTERGCETLLHTAKARMQRFGFMPTVLILPPGAQHYLSFSMERTLAAIGGPNIEQQFTSCSGVPVLSADYIETAPGEMTCPLVRENCVGEFYSVGDELFMQMDGKVYGNGDAEHAHRTVILQLYDEESDVVRNITADYFTKIAKTMRGHDPGATTWDDTTRWHLLSIARWANSTKMFYTVAEKHVKCSPDPFVTRTVVNDGGTLTIRYDVVNRLNDLDVDLWEFTSPGHFLTFFSALSATFPDLLWPSTIPTSKSSIADLRDALDGKLLNYVGVLAQTLKQKKYSVEEALAKHDSIIDRLQEKSNVSMLVKMLVEECMWELDEHILAVTSVKPNKRAKHVGFGKEDVKMPKLYTEKGRDLYFLCEQIDVLEPGVKSTLGRFSLRFLRVCSRAGAEQTNALLTAIEIAQDSIGVQLFDCLRCRPVILRPFIAHNMGSVVAVDTKNAGNTYIGHNDFKLSEDAVSNVYHGNLTFYSKSVVNNPEAVQIYENVFSCGYVHGNCTQPFIFEDAWNYTGRELQEGKNRGSIICLFVPPNSQMCAGGGVAGVEITGCIARGDSLRAENIANTRVMHEQGAFIFSRLNGKSLIRSRPQFYGLAGILPQKGETIDTYDRMEEHFEQNPANFYDESYDLFEEHTLPVLNTICFKGSCAWRRNDSSSFERQTGCGHWKSFSTAGSAQGRSGLPCSMNDNHNDPLRSRVTRHSRGTFNAANRQFQGGYM